MDFGLSQEQQMIVDTTRAFVETELYPHEAMVERTGHLPLELIREIQKKAMAAGLYAANMPAEVGGAGLDTLSWLLYEKELGRANYALHWTCVARPSNILLAGNAEQREQYLMPCIRGETWDCLAMTEPGAGSDLRGMKATAQAGWRRLGAERHQAFHQPCRSGRIRHRLRGDGRRGHPARPEKADHGVFRGQGHARLHRPRRLPQRLASRLHQCRAGIRRLPPEQAADTGRGPQGVRGGEFLAGRHPAAGRLRPALAAPNAPWAMRCPMRPNASSSASRSASSRGVASNWPIWRWS